MCHVFRNSSNTFFTSSHLDSMHLKITRGQHNSHTYLCENYMNIYHHISVKRHCIWIPMNCATVFNHLSRAIVEDNIKQLKLSNSCKFLFATAYIVNTDTYIRIFTQTLTYMQAHAILSLKRLLLFWLVGTLGFNLSEVVSIAIVSIDTVSMTQERQQVQLVN